jgi:hypothetical protein
MLDPRVAELSSRLSEAQFGERREQLHAAIWSVWGEFAKRGSLSRV